jgi:hypothetical protein
MNWISQNKPVVVFGIGIIIGVMVMTYLDKEEKQESAFCC